MNIVRTSQSYKIAQHRSPPMILSTVRVSFLLVVCSLSSMIAIGQQREKVNEFSIVPKPVRLIEGKGFFMLDSTSTMVSDRGNVRLDSMAELMVSTIRRATGFVIRRSTIPAGSGSIVLTVDPKQSGLRKEGYALTVSPRQVRIVGFDEAGVFYGFQSLLQLLPPEITSEQVVHGMEWRIPCITIEDYPRFSWRGMHLDVGRHFFPVSFIKKYLDLMAMYKLNTFHWHLTEDQGWRIEIKRYPLLTQVGAWRKQTMGDGVPYGGFYTQDEIRDVVAYAKERYIVIVPEIEMPGHAKAALAAYPQYSCRQIPIDVGTKWGVEKDVYCAGNDSTFIFLENILKEVFDLFPGKYVHIGGDECPKDRWKECPKCQARIKSEGLRDEQGLQSYFVTRIEQFINANGKRMIGWDEILEGGLPPNATVMSWRGTQGGIDAARSGHDVVMTPTSNCYFDYSQSLTGELDSTRAFLPIDSVYDYEPVPGLLTAEEARHVLGSQGNVWTEWMSDSRRVEYMLLPRMCALSEMVWTPKTLRNYADFRNRMLKQYNRLSCMHVQFRVPTPFTLGGNISSFSDTTVSFSDVPRGADAYYTLDGTEPTLDAARYESPIRLSKSLSVKAKLYLLNGKSSNTVWIDFSRLDSAFNGLTYRYRESGKENSAEPAMWVSGKEGIAYVVSLPEIPQSARQFSINFDGFLTIEQSGLYTFYVQSDSGSLLWINKTELMGNSLPDRHWWRQGAIFLKAGKYPISLFDLEKDEWRGPALEYEGPNIERRSIPARLLSRR
jgi:hexosaminidase